ncbi:galactose-1-phosphate uridylyltransferase [candidate division GN15 bacterium]|nr:galactose-1-phosphate uridylyltransferase [candidate division GN15 bacterium]
MPEFRQNLATKDWVILATERGKRPSDFEKERKQREPAPAYDTNCPFCKGNESQTLEPTYVWPAPDDWKVRVIPNKFAALDPNLSTTRSHVGLFLAAKGFGLAEVVVEHPEHNVNIVSMELEQVTQMLRACRERQAAISQNPKINLVQIFRNYGQGAGTSLIHPHSQIIATPIVPPHVRFPMEQAVLYYDKYGSCVYCDLVREELRQAERVIIESENFVAFCPYAARSPYECRIYPKRHEPSFVLVDDEELYELASVLRDLLGRVHTGLNDPDYNYIIRSSPIGDENTRHLHWYIVVIPKISIPAGFEIGTGIYINTVAPEASARHLRDVTVG